MQLHTPQVLVRVAVAALALAPLASAQFVTYQETLNLGIDDVEITPDGRMAVAREDTFLTNARFYDLTTGTLVHMRMASLGAVTGIAQDAVAVTDTRAVVIGSSVMIFDLTTSPPNLLAQHHPGLFPRDVAITPDGTIAAVRGGEAVGGFPGGLFLFDLASGALLAQAPGGPVPSAITPSSFDVDSVVLTDDEAVFVSYLGPLNAPTTRVTIFELHPGGGGPPVVAFETAPGSDQIGEPHDVALTPDGQYAAVRSGRSVGLYRLNGVQSTQVWHERLWNDPGPFGLSAMDSIEATDAVIATISRRSNGGIGAQLDLFELSGVQRVMILSGDPHDLAFTPSGERLVVRTHIETYLYDVVNLPAGNFLSPLDREIFDGTHTSFGAGMDSVAVTDSSAITLSRVNATTNVRVWDISNDLLVPVLDTVLPSEPLDLAITPDETKVVVTGLTHVQVLDLRTDSLLLDYDPTPGGAWPWCDGVVANDSHAVAFGLTANNSSGWLSLLDLFADPSAYCQVNPNSTGAAAELFATGSARFSANDLTVTARNLPPLEFGVFFYGDGVSQAPFGDGFRCVTGQVARFPLTASDPAGFASLAVDYQSLPPGGGAIVAGTTWNFQYAYRDAASMGAGFNATQGLTIAFVN